MVNKEVIIVYSLFPNIFNLVTDSDFIWVVYKKIKLRLWCYDICCDDMKTNAFTCDKLTLNGFHDLW